MVKIKPGWLTSEGILTAALAVIGILAGIGVIGPQDRGTLEDAIRGAVSHAAGFIASVAVLWRYIHSRSDLKKSINGNGTSPPANGNGGKIGNGGLPLLVVFCLALFASGAQAQAPGVWEIRQEAETGRVIEVFDSTPACFLGLRDQRTERDLEQLRRETAELRQQVSALLARQPAQPQIIVLQGGERAPQIIPIDPHPRQDLPVERLPRLVLPLDVQPRMILPLETQPKQTLPNESLPPQKPPLPAHPPMTLPNESKPPQTMPQAPVGYQRFTRALYPQP